MRISPILYQHHSPEYWQGRLTSPAPVQDGLHIIFGQIELGTFHLRGATRHPGVPNQAQQKIMIKKLLADRLQLKFHNDQKELSAYVLTVAKGGPKMKKSEADPNGPALLRDAGNWNWWPGGLAKTVRQPETASSD